MSNWRLPQVPDSDLAVTLTFTAGEHGHLETEVAELAAPISETAARLTDAEARTQAIQRTLDVASKPTPQRQRLHMVSDLPPSDTWDDAVRRSRALTGDSPADLDDLLTQGELASINRRFGDGFVAHSRLDHYDIVAAVAAGVTAAMLDYLVVAVPNKASLTKALRSLSQDSDNWLSSLAKVPYDRVAEVDLSGFYPQSHRVQTFGHDPLLGWVYGTMDILRGSLTGVSRDGVVKSLDVGASPTSSVAVALALQAMHLVSDIVTPAGLPLPGWTALLTVDKSILGSEHTVAELSRWMYLRGYDTWHLPALAAPLLGSEAVLRGYLGLRQLLDEEYREELDLERALVNSDRVADLPRYEVMALIARGIAAAGNAGRFALSGANPLTLNFPLWMAFAKSLLASLNRATPASSMVDAAKMNRLILDAGWVSLEIDQNDLPEIVV